MTQSFIESVLDDIKWNLLANLSFMMFRRLTAPQYSPQDDAYATDKVTEITASLESFKQFLG